MSALLELSRLVKKDFNDARERIGDALYMTLPGARRAEIAKATDTVSILKRNNFSQP